MLRTNGGYALLEVLSAMTLFALVTVAYGSVESGVLHRAAQPPEIPLARPLESATCKEAFEHVTECSYDEDRHVIRIWR